MRWRAAVTTVVFGVSGAAALFVQACGSRTGLDVPPGAPNGGLDAQQGVDAPFGVDGARTHPSLDCAEAGITFIYAIGEDNSLYSFYPATGEFTLVGVIDCPAPSGAEPFSMAVDHKGVAYVVFGNGMLFRVSTKTGACEATSFVPGQHGFTTFGMGFVANVSDGGSGETLYVAGDANNALGTIDVDTFELRQVAPFGGVNSVSVSGAELTGTGDGRLFGFFEPPVVMTGAPFNPSYIVQIDPKTAGVLSGVELPGVVEGNGWAFGFWGGDFYTYTAPDDTTTVVTRYRPSDGSIVKVASAPFGVVIVGAGVSTCAPQQ